MKRLKEFRQTCRSAFLTVLFVSTLQGANSKLLISSVSPDVVKDLAGNNVTLAVSFTGASNPTLTWFRDGLPVVTWTINSVSPPDIDPNSKDVLHVEKNGSLTFIKVPVNYSSNYRVEMTKSGLGTDSHQFTLQIFEMIQSVTLNTPPIRAKEGIDQFTLQYSMLRGVIEQQTWFFNSKVLKNSSHYLVQETSLVILGLNRNDTGLYSVRLTNPFSNVTAQKEVIVFYGPDEPILKATPEKSFYVAGDSVSLSCQSEGTPQLTVEWIFNGQILSMDSNGVLDLKNVQTNQGGVYTCSLLNPMTNEKREKNVTLNIYERPPGSPVCSVLSVNNDSLLYECDWMGGTPPASLSFPALSSAITGEGNLSLTFPASTNLNGKTVTCQADHPIQQNTCNITARNPKVFLPEVRATVDVDSKIVVSILCVSEASPQAVVSWSNDSGAIANGTAYQISSDTTELKIRDNSISNLILQNFTCTCRNPLGSQTRRIQLQGPSISDSRVFPNQDGTIITLTWEVPPTSVVTGFDIQMKGANLIIKKGNTSQAKITLDGYHTIQQKPASARSTDVFTLDPKQTYLFRIIPKARLADGVPSVVHRIGPPDGLSGPAIAGIAAGIPCSILAIILVGGLIFLIIYLKRNRSHQTKYPVPRTTEKAIPPAKINHPEIIPHKPLAGGLKFFPDYNSLHQSLSDRSVALPAFVPPPPHVRVATTV
ncbi:V-set and immunoglobulin domain-containing protein 10-like [Oryzias melastigma]|uniref:V-set and immunoglobulin domain containing 10 like n=1 Tax=Oryzias melastigma TaxID=30732 RepID=A0A3B3DXY2_ORYME|nr:V-set and immunoglobulin domain-containing protein 10-like [Oryzias melastigma]